MTHCYVIGGVRVTTHLSAELPESGFSDVNLALELVTDPTPPAGYDGLPSTGIVRASLSTQGTIGLLATDDWNQVDPETAAVAIRGVAPFAAARQGALTLHASCVTWRGTTVAFVGASGTGKSTMRRELERCGAVAVSDDLLPLREQDGKWCVPKSGLAPLTQLDALVFPRRSSNRDRATLVKLAQTDAMLNLLKHGFGEVPDKAIWAMQFAAYASVANQVPAIEIDLPDDLTWLSRMLGSLYSDICRMAA